MEKKQIEQPTPEFEKGSIDSKDAELIGIDEKKINKEKVLIIPPKTKIQEAYGTNRNGVKLSRKQIRKMGQNSKALSKVYVNYVKSFKKVMKFNKKKLDFTENSKAAVKYFDKLWKHHCKSKGFIGEQTLSSFVNETEVIKCVLILETRDSVKANIDKLIGLHKKNKLDAVALADLYLESLTKT